eukprot:scaffold58308_cov68-Phaeocystis_antarctica.AAC.5
MQYASTAISSLGPSEIGAGWRTSFRPNLAAGVGTTPLGVASRTHSTASGRALPLFPGEQRLPAPCPRSPADLRCCHHFAPSTRGSFLNLCPTRYGRAPGWRAPLGPPWAKSIARTTQPPDRRRLGRHRIDAGRFAMPVPCARVLVSRGRIGRSTAACRGVSSLCSGTPGPSAQSRTGASATRFCPESNSAAHGSQCSWVVSRTAHSRLADEGRRRTALAPCHKGGAQSKSRRCARRDRPRHPPPARRSQ